MRVDLIICTYNNAAMLDKTLAAISLQKPSAEIVWEVLVVNNNCTDETPQIVEKYARSFPVALNMIDEPKQGVHHARVSGIKKTKGDWVAFIDDDCLIAENFVEELSKFIAEHPKCGLFGARILLEWEIDPPIYASTRKWAYAGKNHGDLPQKRDWIAGAGMVLKRTAIDESGWLEQQFLEDRTGKSLISGGDMEMGMRIASVCEAWYNPDCVIKHQIPARRLTREYVRKITFGLGASRHNVAALSWRGSYFSWAFYSFAYSIGLLIYALFNAITEFATSPKGADIPSAFTPVFGWWSAMWTMFRMEKRRRKSLLGSVIKV